MARLCQWCGVADISHTHHLRRYCIDCDMNVRSAGRGAAPAAQAVNKAVRLGEIRPATDFQCVDCGDPAECYDHRDYSKPLEVQPVCGLCNNKRGPGKYVANSRQAAESLPPPPH